jgi:hypothetical protein
MESNGSGEDEVNFQKAQKQNLLRKHHLTF